MTVFLQICAADTKKLWAAAAPGGPAFVEMLKEAIEPWQCLPKVIVLLLQSRKDSDRPPNIMVYDGYEVVMVCGASMMIYDALWCFMKVVPEYQTTWVRLPKLSQISPQPSCSSSWCLVSSPSSWEPFLKKKKKTKKPKMIIVDTVPHDSFPEFQVRQFVFCAILCQCLVSFSLGFCSIAPAVRKPSSNPPVLWLVKLHEPPCIAALVALPAAKQHRLLRSVGKKLFQTVSNPRQSLH